MYSVGILFSSEMHLGGKDKETYRKAFNNILFIFLYISGIFLFFLQLEMIYSDIRSLIVQIGIVEFQRVTM